MTSIATDSWEEQATEIRFSRKVREIPDAVSEPALPCVHAVLGVSSPSMLSPSDAPVKGASPRAGLPTRRPRYYVFWNPNRR